MNLITPNPNLNPRHIASAQHSAPRFQGVLGQEALQGLAVDTLGILAPKLVVARGNMHRTEEWVLEGLENVVFYFTVPLAGQYLFSKALKGVAGVLGTKTTSSALGATLSANAAKNPVLLGAKAGTVLGTVALASGLEFLVPHIKNLVTAKVYQTKNFTAVANLEAARSEVHKGESDPVEKARKRLLPIALTTAGTISLAFSLPWLTLKSKTLQQGLRFLTRHVDFGQGSPFDMSKPILAILAGVGLGAYVDASRDGLERKEVFSRLTLFTIPYYLFGKEIAGNGLAALLQEGKVKLGTQFKKIRDIVPLIDSKATKTSFLDFNNVIDSGKLKAALKAQGVGKTTQTAILHRLDAIWYGKFALSALIVGVLANIWSYHQTQKRHDLEKRNEQALAFQKRQFAQWTATQANSPFAGNRQYL